jgi:hypothetical protein
MIHRGPDGAGTWISNDGRVGLGHRRLSIIDLSDAATQPMCNEDATLWLSFNGEIYNHAEIRQELEKLGGHQWKTDHSDTEVILHAFEQWGIDCVHKFRGMPRLKPAPIPHYALPTVESPFPAWYFERLEKMAEFTMHITKPTNHIPQIGDNDSGRFLKLNPVYQYMTVAEAKARYVNLDGYDELPDKTNYWDEVHLEHRHLVAAINGLFHRNDFATFMGGNNWETELIKGLTNAIQLKSYKRDDEPTAAEQVRIGCNEFETYNEKYQKLEIPLPMENIREGLKLFAYPDFGLYIYRSQRLYLAIRCGTIGQNGNGGHAHNDQLSIELNVDGDDWISDPGIYLYSPLPKKRNMYRSVKVHFAPRLADKEQSQIDQGLFKLGNEIQTNVIYFSSEAFWGNYLSSDVLIHRIIRIFDNKIELIDFWEAIENKQIEKMSLTPLSLMKRKILSSPGYGKELK